MEQPGYPKEETQRRGSFWCTAVGHTHTTNVRSFVYSNIVVVALTDQTTFNTGGLPAWKDNRGKKSDHQSSITAALQYPSTHLTCAGAGLGPSPAPHCSPHRAPGLPGDGGTPAASISALSCHSPCPCCACWSSQAVMEDSGGPGATSQTQARSRTSKDERFRMGTCGEKTRRSKTGAGDQFRASFVPRKCVCVEIGTPD